MESNRENSLERENTRNWSRGSPKYRSQMTERTWSKPKGREACNNYERGNFWYGRNCWYEHRISRQGKNHFESNSDEEMTDFLRWMKSAMDGIPPRRN